MHVLVDAKDLLHYDQRSPRFPIGFGYIGIQFVAITGL
jgi:hypothetical protein